MTLLTICTELALAVGREPPSQIIASSDQGWKEAADFSRAAAEELVRRVAWGNLTSTATLTGNGTNKKHSLPSYFSRLVDGVCCYSGTSIIRPLTRAEWDTLTATQGTPRYFLLEPDGITLWPYLASAATVTIKYQTKAWCSNGTDAWTSDGETALVDEHLLAKGTIARWRRQKGMPYADEEAEYEAALQQFADFSERNRL